MNRLCKSVFYAAIALAASTPASAKCYQFGVWSKETYCFADPDDTPVWIDPAPERLDLPFIEVLRAFEGVTGTASEYLSRPAPASTDELDSRVSEFYAAAHRENDYFAQGVEYLEGVIATINQGIAETTSYIEANASTAEQLTAKFDGLQVDLRALYADRGRWQARVAQFQKAANDYSLEAHYARRSVLELIAAVVPKDSLLVTSATIDSAESLQRQFTDRSKPWPICCSPAPLAADPAVNWKPQDRPLNIDLSAPRDVKISTLWQLSEIMRNNSLRLDALAAERGVKMAELTPLSERESIMKRELSSLENGIMGLESEMATAAQDVDYAKQDSLDARDKMVMSALQLWVWEAARDDLINPGVRAFLTANGFDQMAERLGADTIWDVTKEIRNLTWSDALGIRGLDEFKAVQEKTIQLLNPSQSLILQSAEINAWATPAEGERFTRTVFERLGDDAVDYFKAAGQVNVDEQYQGLLRKLMGGLDGTQSSDE